MHTTKRGTFEDFQNGNGVSLSDLLSRRSSKMCVVHDWEGKPTTWKVTPAEIKEVNDTWGETECPECDGHGDVDVGDESVETCPVCNGEKTVPVKLEVKDA